ncbi:MAG: hypothetical protein ABUK01_00375 [Leptospirales bacterium]
MVFIISIITSAVLTLFFGLRGQFAKKETQVYLVRSYILGIILIPIVGGLQGSFHSDAFSIPWWFFGLINFFAISLMAVIAIVILKIFSSAQKEQ